MSPEIDTTQTLLRRALEVYERKTILEAINLSGSPRIDDKLVRDWMKNSSNALLLSEQQRDRLRALLPTAPIGAADQFRFIDLFAGIGGIRRGFEEIGGRCVLTSEYNRYAVRTYKANHFSATGHIFNDDVRKLTRSAEGLDLDDAERRAHILNSVPAHDVLLAGFPCQPFSLAGVSKKNSMGRAHGFACAAQGTLFFDIALILDARRPAAFVLENVAHLKSHDKGNTFRIIKNELKNLGYWVADIEHEGPDDPKIVDAKHFTPQQRKRIILVGFDEQLGIHDNFTLRDIRQFYPASVPSLADLLETRVPDNYILTPGTWKSVFRHAERHRQKGNGFGFGLIKDTRKSITRTLSHRYYKDGAEILIDRGFDPNLDVSHPDNIAQRPRKLTPRECARLMGFDGPGQSNFRIPVSDTQAWQQFGNSVVVPVFASVAKLMESRIKKIAAGQKTA